MHFAYSGLTTVVTKEKRSIMLLFTEFDVWGIHLAWLEVKYDMLQAVYLFLHGKYSLKEFSEVLRG